MSSATQPVFVKDSWQTPRNARSLRAFMALQNQEIAARIRELRGSRPQTLVADEMGVSERTLQNWEAGTSKPSYRSLQAIATYYEVPEEFILTGGRRSLARTGGTGETPDVFPVTVNRLDGELEARITRIEGTLQEILLLLGAARSEQDRISGLLDQQTSVLERIEAATSDAGDAAERLDAAVRAADRALRSAPPEPPASTARTGRKSSPRAAR